MNFINKMHEPIFKNKKKRQKTYKKEKQNNRVFKKVYNFFVNYGHMSQWN